MYFKIEVDLIITRPMWLRRAEHSDAGGLFQPCAAPVMGPDKLYRKVSLFFSKEHLVWLWFRSGSQTFWKFVRSLITGKGTDKWKLD